MALLKLLTGNGITPYFIRNGPSIIFMEIKDLNIRFIPHENYLSGDIFNIANQFDIKFSKCYFPFSLLTAENFDYFGKIPPLEDFLSKHFDESEAREIEKFILKQGSKTWNFRKELITYMQQKLLLTTLAFLKFLREFLLFQEALNAKEFLNPFTSPTCTIGGAFFRLYKLLYLEKYPLFIVKNEYASRGKFISRLEHEYLSYLEYKNYSEDDNLILTALNNPNGQKYFPEAIPDGYVPKDKTAFMICGCYWHLCPQCNLIKNLDKCNKANADFYAKLERLILNNPTQLERVNVIWEHTINEMKQTDTDFISFLDHVYIKRPLKTLIPRDCYRGGYHDTYFLKWSSNLCLDDNLHFLDFNSLFSFVSIKNKFMFGPYSIFMGQSLSNIKIINHKFFLNDEQVMGSIFLTILPPNDLLYPFLMYKAKNGTVYNPLCSTCTEKKQKSLCQHSENERAITGCYLLSEIEYALTLGYKILHIYECHIYTQFDYILKDFVEPLAFFKTAASNCFENLKSKKQKNDYCSYLNQKMNFNTNFQFTLKNIKPNVSKRYFYKLAQNTFFGKFGQRTDTSKTVYCTSQEEIETTLSEHSKISDAFIISEDLCAVQYDQLLSKIKPSLKTNMYISAQITAFAREVMHKILMDMETQKIKVIQINCDSLIFALPKDKPCPLTVSHAIGDFKYELEGQILNYFAVGSKNYIIVFKNTENEIKTLNRISGLSLKAEQINVETYRTFISNLEKDIECAISVPNRKRKIDWRKLNIEITSQQFKISNRFPLRRIFSNNTLITLPFGFKPT